MTKSLLFTLSLLATSAHAFEVTTLRTEYTDTPLGIDMPAPRLSWQMHSPRQGARQSVYQIKVQNDLGQEVWNTGRIASDISLGIAYEGAQLQPETRYTWQVEVWDELGETARGESWFETGLQCHSDRDAAWQGAQWIGGGEEALSFYSQYLSVFRIRWQVQLDRKRHTTEASLLYGGNDHRLLDPNKNILGVKAAPDASYIKVTLNTAPLLQRYSATVDIYRVGYTTDDQADQPLARLTIDPSLLNAENQYEPHQLEIASNFGVTQIYLDGSEQPLGEVNLNPMGRGGDYIAFPVVGDMGFSVPKGQRATFDKVEVRNYRDPFHTLSHVTSTPLRVSGESALCTPPETGTPLLRTTFAAHKQVRSARI